MPGGDRTGPMGAGPRTGRGAGDCAVYTVPGYTGHAFGRGFGGRGRGVYGAGVGRGRRNMYYATGMPGWQRTSYGHSTYNVYRPSANEEKEMLKSEAEALKRELEDIQERIRSLETSQDQ